MPGSRFDEKQLLWSGKELLPHPDSLGQRVLDALTRFGDRIAHIDDSNGISLRYDDVRSKSIRIAQNLRTRGYGSHQIVGIVAATSHRTMPVVFATLYMGSTVNPMNPAYSRNDLRHMLSATQPDVMFCDANMYGLVKECLTELANAATIFTFGGQVGESEPVESLLVENDDEADFVLSEVNTLEDVAFIVRTSGYTGVAKDVCQSHAMMRVSDLTVNSSAAVILYMLPLNYITGVTTLLYGIMTGSTFVTTTQPSSPALQFHLIEKYKINAILNTPVQTIEFIKSDLLTSADLSTMEWYTTGGSKTPRHLLAQLKRAVPNAFLLYCYGVTEAGGGTAALIVDASGTDSVGHLDDGMHAKIVDDTGRRCGVGVDGELCVKGPAPFLGYHKNPTANEKLIDSEGFLLTGDIAHFDEHGLLYVVERKSDVLKYQNRTIFPTKIETHLMDCESIETACVVGIPDGDGDDLIAACVVRQPGADIDEAQVCQIIERNFADHCKLRGGVFFVDFLPRTISGKIIRREVKAIAMDLHIKKTL